MKKNWVIHIILFALFLSAALLSTYNRTDQTSIEAEARKIENRLGVIEQSFYNLVQDKSSIVKIISKDYSSRDLKRYAQYKFDFFIYQEGSLVFWSDNSAVPLYDIAEYNEGSNFVKLRNGWYELIKITTSEDVVVCGLIQINSDYGVENAYLQNRINPYFKTDDKLFISPTKEKGSAFVSNSKGVPIFTVSKTNRSRSIAGFGEQALYWISLLLLCLLISSIAVTLAKDKSPVGGFVFLIVGFTTVRLIFHFVSIPFSDTAIDLFNPSVYASGILTKSLGEMLINISLLLWISIYWFAYVRENLRLDNPFPRMVAYTLMALLIIAIQQIIKSFVIDSNISFELDNFLELSVFSIVGLLLISLILLLYWTITYGIIKQIGSDKLGWKDFKLIIPAILLMTIYLIVTKGVAINLFSILWFVVFVILIHNYFKNRSPLQNFSSIILILFLFSCWTAVVLEYYNYEKELGERKLFAVELAEERDLMTETLIQDIAPRLRNDEFVKGFFTNPYVSKRDITERIAYLYLSDISKKYDYSVYTFDSNGEPFKTNSGLKLSYFRNKITSDCDTIIDNNLYFIPEKSGRYAYYIDFPLEIANGLDGNLLIELTPKIFTTSNVYPELLLEERFRNPESRKYFYAVYVFGSLIGQKGDFPYDYFLDEETRTIAEEFKHINNPQYSHLVYSPGEDKNIIVSVERERWLKPLSVFSYIFCFLLLLSLLITGVVLYRNFPGDNSNAFFWLSFRNRITISMILIIIISFLIIGLVTARYFTNEYELYHKQRLIRKEKAVLSALEYYIKGNSDVNFQNGNEQLVKKELSVNVASLSDIHSMDINLFNKSGDLLVSSKPEIFQKGLVSGKMEPLAYYHLSSINRNQYLHEEKIGLLKFLSVYVPVRDETGETLAFLNLPYFAQSSNLKEEISNFMVALVNVYVFLLVCAGFVAFFISNSITRPLTEISEKLRLLNLTKSNEPIEWKRKDEIGELVNEYNKMIKELEKSVQLLAKSERETAWREMAKQIAHEIKNPLTPMKLSIQYLQRSLEQNDANVEELARRVSNTLIEQIDNLSEIATAFSSFAKMPKAKNEVLELESVAQSVFDLFKDTPGVHYTFDSDLRNAEVIADKNQLISAFNNLMKNASQAIPDETDGEVKMSLYPNSDGYIIEVSDNGKGIEDHLKDKVFVPNFTTKSSGTGLGLAITKRVIENAQGMIWFESESEKGTRFFIKLPKHLQV